ncbi:MAG: bifunctional DedA family/phosphatase PAP2 family protein [Endozoicomonadaceae bacterium]|nr:bifunctional DedA family/phosphatase PAP2 family protein [Endozoicomonadaceae bacterium]
MIFTDIFKPLQQYIFNHSDCLFWFILIISLAESLAIAGIIVPGVFLLFLAATLAGKGYLSFKFALLAGGIGACIGDWLSFFLGYFFHSHIREWSLFEKYKKWINKGEQFFVQYGQLSVFTGRFAGPLRAVLPLIAGMMGMPVVKFLIIDIIAAILWAVAYLLPGYLVGASMQWTDLISAEFTFTVISIALVAWLSCFFYWKWMYKKRSLAYMTRLISVLSIFVILLGLLVKTGTAQNINEKLAFNIVHNETILTSEIAIFFTLLGDKITQFIWAMIIFGSFWLAGNKRSAITFGFSIMLLTLISYGIKYGLNIPRPSNLAGEINHSFPSGHTTISTLLFLVLAKKLQCSVKHNLRFIIWGLAIFLSLMIALSRLYLNMHWLTDVTAGFLLGITAYIFWQYLEKKVSSVSGTYQPILLIVTLTLVTAILAVFLYPSMMIEYLG